MLIGNINYFYAKHTTNQKKQIGHAVNIARTLQNLFNIILDVINLEILN